VSTPPIRAEDQVHRSRSTVHVALAVCIALLLGACLPASIRPTPTPGPTPTPAPTPTPPPTPTPGPPTPTPGPTFLLYTVVRGDTLTSIARKQHTSARSVAYWNRDQYPSLDPESPKYNPDSLKRGWILRIIPGQEYAAPSDNGETGEQVTASPDDSGSGASASPDESASPDASASSGG
jgi:hypothetical protein